MFFFTSEKLEGSEGENQISGVAKDYQLDLDLDSDWAIIAQRCG